MNFVQIAHPIVLYVFLDGKTDLRYNKKYSLLLQKAAAKPEFSEDL